MASLLYINTINIFMKLYFQKKTREKSGTVLHFYEPL